MKLSLSFRFQVRDLWVGAFWDVGYLSRVPYRLPHADSVEFDEFESPDLAPLWQVTPPGVPIHRCLSVWFCLVPCLCVRVRIRLREMRLTR